jgi:hypothetical protein
MYYFQLRLPVDVQKYFQCRQLKKSLKTNRYREAVTLVNGMTAKIEEILFMTRTGFLTRELIQQICSGC